MLKPYPVGRQDFETVITEGYKYIDKTQRMWEMMQHRHMVFLSRPRRFGKSMLVRTLHAYFEGKKELFKGLAIESLEKDWVKYPVIRLDMSAVKDDSLETIENAIAGQFEPYESLYGIIPKEGLSSGARFYAIIQSAYSKTGKKVVVIIDEYDAPLLAHLHDGFLEDYKRILQNIYQQLKVCEDIERFVFITGISRFSQVSIFSTLNNLQNISMDPQFDDICGFSKQEVVTNFKEDIECLAQKFECAFDDMVDRLKYQYDGYHFSGGCTDMFNPLSLLSCFQNKELNNYWFETATSSYVIEHLREFKVNAMDLEGVRLFDTGFYMSPEDFKSVYSLLYQAGYLTIKSYDARTKRYEIGYPNNEVRVSMLDIMMPSWVNVSRDMGKNYMCDFYFALVDQEFDKAFSILRDFFLQIPNVLNNKEEKHFQTICYVLFTWLGFYNQAEVYTATGRIDILLHSDAHIFIMELKVDESAQIALNQINSLHYADKYVSSDKDIVKIGVNFSSQTRTVEDWIIER